ncbi:MAG: hypothetical protein JNM63_05650, partial [Spirochaetia bacterium]|nr:hypothetical protein [Spirochaetia bacterium]
AENASREKNLLRNTRLVSGLPSGWNVTGRINAHFSENEDVIFKTDESVKGPSGSPAFLIDVLASEGVPSSYGWAQQVYVYSAPFKPTREESHTASVYISGNGSGEFAVVGSNLSAAATQKFSVAEGEGWKRVSCTFRANSSEKHYALSFKLKGKFWLDGFQVNPGDKAAAFSPEFSAETALAAADGELGAVRIHFDDETPSAAWTVLGAKAGDILKGKVFDLGGASANLSEVKLKGDKSESGKWNYLLPGLGRYGQFRVEVRVENAAGAKLSDDNEMVFTRLHRPRYWGKDAPLSPFGVHIQPISSAIGMAKAFGINWVRLHDAGIQLVGWRFLENEPDTWRFFDKELDRYRRGNL